MKRICQILSVLVVFMLVGCGGGSGGSTSTTTQANEDYDEAVRQTWSGVRSGQVVTNSASPAVVTVTTGSTFGGAALISSNTKGGSSGIMFCGVVATEGNQT